MDLRRKLKKALAVVTAADRALGTAKSESARRHAESVRLVARSRFNKASKKLKRASRQKQLRSLGLTS